MPDRENPPANVLAVTRAYRRRLAGVVTVFAAMGLAIVLFGTVGFEGVNILRSYATGESHWAKAQKSAVVALERYADTRRAADYRDFEAAVRLIDGDQAARDALEAARPDFDAAGRGLRAGGNDAADVPGLVAGFVLFHAWGPFAEAVSDWKRGDAWFGEIAAIGRHMHETGAASAGDLARLAVLDAELTRNETFYSAHMNEASREAALMTLGVFVLLTLMVCSVAIAVTRGILRTSMGAERRAVESEARVRDFVELATDWFCETDKRFRITYASSFLARPGADPVESMVGMSWLSLGRHIGFKDIDGVHAQALENMLPFRDHRFRQTGADGVTKYWSVWGKPQFDEHGAFAGYRAIATDITGFIETEQQLGRARDEAERANRAKSAFLANMSHELRTPLNAILGFSELIGMQVQQGKGEPRHGSYAHDIQTSGRHLLAIINDLLEHSRVEAGEMSLHIMPFEATEAVEAVRTLCQPRADALGVMLRTEVPAGLPLVKGDELRFKQVLINIVTNAIKFSPDGEVTLSAHRDGAMLCIEVLDTGIGMDAAGIEQALKPFGQADSGLNRKYEGTGLGVPLAKALTELQGGEFAIASKPGAGTRVTITVPLAVEAMREPLAVAAA
jgi:signal transduction histidine kinase